MDLQIILLNKNIREDILKYKWPRKTSIEKDRIKYIKGPYTIKDVEMSMKFKSVNCFKEFLKNSVNVYPVCLLNNSKTLEMFEIYLEYQICKGMFRKDVLNNINSNIFIEKGYLDIVKYIHNSGYLRDNDVHKINHPEMYDFLVNNNLLEDYPDLLFSNMFGDEVIIHLIEENKMRYTLRNAIEDNRIDVIDYLIDNGILPSSSDVCELIEIGYDKIEDLQLTSTDEIAYKSISECNYMVIDKLMEAGFDVDTMMDCARELNFYEMEEFLYNY